MPKGEIGLAILAGPKSGGSSKKGESSGKGCEEDNARKKALREAREDAAAQIITAVKSDNAKALCDALDDYWELKGY